MNKLASIKHAPFMPGQEWVLAQRLCQEGRLDEARAVLNEKLPTLTTDELDKQLAYYNLLAQIECAAKNYQTAITLLTDNYLLTELTEHESLRAEFHTILGNARFETGSYDQALLAYDAARFHAESGADKEYVANLKNNIACVLIKLNRLADARIQLTEARQLTTNQIILAQIDISEAQTYLTEGNAEQAYARALDACRVLLLYGETRLSVEAGRTLQQALVHFTEAVLG